jgi:hypothetical protein
VAIESSPFLDVAIMIGHRFWVRLAASVTASIALLVTRVDAIRPAAATLVLVGSIHRMMRWPSQRCGLRPGVAFVFTGHDDFYQGPS